MKILCCPYGGCSQAHLPDPKRAQKMLDGTGKCALYCQRKGNEVLPWRKPEPLVRQIMS